MLCLFTACQAAFLGYGVLTVIPCPAIPRLPCLAVFSRRAARQPDCRIPQYQTCPSVADLYALPSPCITVPNALALEIAAGSGAIRSIAGPRAVIIRRAPGIRRTGDNRARGQAADHGAWNPPPVSAPCCGIVGCDNHCSSHDSGCGKSDRSFFEHAFFEHDRPHRAFHGQGINAPYCGMFQADFLTRAAHAHEIFVMFRLFAGPDMFRIFEQCGSD